MDVRPDVRYQSNTMKKTRDHRWTVDTRADPAAEGSLTMTTSGWSGPKAFDRVTCGEAAYGSVTLLLEERMHAASEARRAEDRTRTRSLRARAGMAVVALGTRIGGRALERPVADTLPSPTLARQAGAGRAG